MNAKQVVETVLNRSVVWVTEEGTTDGFQALYIDNALVVENPRRDVMAVLDALGIVPETVHVAYGFDGNFPEQLSDLVTHTK